jgi:hypothetical protein
MNNPLVNQQALLRKIFIAIFPDSPIDDIDELLTPPVAPIMGGDGQAVDPSLTQDPNTTVMPGGREAMVNGGGASMGATSRGKATQTGQQGGGGKGTSAGNNPRARASQSGTKLKTSVTPGR